MWLAVGMFISAALSHLVPLTMSYLLRVQGRRPETMNLLHNRVPSSSINTARKVTETLVNTRDLVRLCDAFITSEHAFNESNVRYSSMLEINATKTQR